MQLTFAMPGNVRAAERRAGWRWKSTAPDGDKCLRLICDALQAGGLVRDDARFADVHATKIETVDGPTGAHITIEQLDAAALVSAMDSTQGALLLSTYDLVDCTGNPDDGRHCTCFTDHGDEASCMLRRAAATR